MKKKIVFILLFAFFSCSNDQDYLICNSSNSEHCKYFEIEYPNSIKEFQKLNIDAMGNELTIKDLNFYLNVNDTFLDNANSESIFHEFYNGVFIPRFSYSLLNRFGEEDLWFAIALYPVDKKNDLITTLDTFYNHEDLKFSNESIYGQCLNDKNSYFNSKNTKIFNCVKDGLASYDYWVEVDSYMWRLKCVWNNPKVIIYDEKVGVEFGASDICRNFYESFTSKIN